MARLKQNTGLSMAFRLHGPVLQGSQWDVLGRLVNRRRPTLGENMEWNTDVSRLTPKRVRKDIWISSCGVILDGVVYKKYLYHIYMYRLDLHIVIIYSYKCIYYTWGRCVNISWFLISKWTISFEGGNCRSPQNIFCLKDQLQVISSLR